MTTGFTGVRITGGAAPFQIVQQNENGLGTVMSRGVWFHESGHGTVQLRIVRESDGNVVSDQTNWQNAVDQDDEQWSHSFDKIPAGGLYRLETRLSVEGAAPEWGSHGDIVHHLGVGDLWIIAGQSNAAGYGRGPVNDPPQLGVHILRNDETWDLAAHPLNDTTQSTHPNIENANPGHSPYLRFAKDLFDALGFPIGLIQTSLGGSPLAAWNPVENPDAPLFHNLIHCFNLAGGKVKGMVWYQGESDCGIDPAQSYGDRFDDFIRHLRDNLDHPDLPVITAQLNRYTDRLDEIGHRGWSVVREAQRRAEKIGNVAVVSTLDLPISDLIHTSSPGNITLGERKAKAALGMVYGRNVSWRAPNVQLARSADDGQAIILTFDHVQNRLEFLGPGDKDFHVEDALGFIEIVQASCPTQDTVRLNLSRKVGPSACVHGCFGAYPPSNLRDAESNMPILGFYDLTVQSGE